ncbi:MAG: mandelate racemase/muconate lactonizing enzyme family protein [Bryobacterales bacterium]|nr:mandelate racemase/muconate lactonizing enzyme family protein [Bryobacterales bacterium]
MKITAVETIYLKSGIRVHAGPVQYLWVRLHTDEGLSGLGETYPFPLAAQAVIHSALAGVLLGRDPSAIDKLWADMLVAVSYSGWAGAEMRAISAVDLALWDLKGKALNAPVYQLLGGASRQSIRTYNTCYDRVDFLTEPVKLAQELYDSGIRAMKIWPFDSIARQNSGQFITPEQIRAGIEPLGRIRDEFGGRMEVAMEFHGYWNLPSAIRIAHALEPLAPLWLEEMLPQDNLAAYRELKDATRTPLCLSERLMTRWGFRELLANGAASIVMPDLCWCGGLSEAKKIASAAETHYLPVAPHNCGGPLLHMASLHLAANLTNLHILESVRRHYSDEYAGLLTQLVTPVNGEFPLPPGPGLGAELDPAVLRREDVFVERSSL